MLLLSYLLAGCSPGPAGVAPDSDWAKWAVDEAGLFEVGFKTWTHDYEPGSQFDSDLGGTRSIALNVWYPTTLLNGEAATYLSGFYTDPQAFLDADVEPPVHSGGYPLMVYSHGDMGFGGDSASISRHFASHGWVVVAPDHTDNTLIDTVSPRPTDHYLHRPLDLRASIDAFEQLGSSEPLSMVNTKAVLVTGHSFGCYSVWAVAGARFDADSLSQQCLNLEEGSCSEGQKEAFLSGSLADERVASAVTMGGSIRSGFFGTAGHLEVGSPLMLMSGTEDNHGVPESWEDLQPMPNLSWLELVGGCHQSFATGICSSLDAEIGFGLVGAYSLAQGRRDVLADDSEEVRSLLDGERSLSDLANYSPASSMR